MSSGCSAIKAFENYSRTAAAPHHAVTVFIFFLKRAGDTHFLIGPWHAVVCAWVEIAMILSILINSKVRASTKNKYDRRHGGNLFIVVCFN